MHPPLKHQLRTLDQLLLSLLDERARLLSGIPLADVGRAPAVDDMLARHAGPFPSRGVVEVFSAVHRNCTGFSLVDPPPIESAGSRSEIRG